MKKTNTTKALEEKVIALESRIAELEKMLKSVNTTTRTTKTAKADAKKSTTTTTTVGNLVFCDRWVKTGTGFMSSKARYAIGQSIINDFGGIKLTKGNPTYEKCVKEDKYVQVYEFKTVEDCKKFMNEQMARVGA